MIAAAAYAAAATQERQTKLEQLNASLSRSEFSGARAHEQSNLQSNLVQIKEDTLYLNTQQSSLLKRPSREVLKH